MVLPLVSIVLVGICVSFLYIHIQAKGSESQSCGMESGKYKIDCLCGHSASKSCAQKKENELLDIQKLTSLEHENQG